MAERDQLGCAFCSHDAGDPGGAQHVALLGVARHDQLERRFAHDDLAFGHRLAFGGGLGRYVHHARLATGVDMGEGGARGSGLPRHQSVPVALMLASRESSAFVAAATSACRIRLSPTRKVEMPTRARRARSAGAKIPLSPTSSRSFGIKGASASLVDSVVSNVRRLRLLMPTIGERSLRARSSSARSWISIRTSMP